MNMNDMKQNPFNGDADDTGPIHVRQAAPQDETTPIKVNPASDIDPAESTQPVRMKSAVLERKHRALKNQVAQKKTGGNSQPLPALEADDLEMLKSMSSSSLPPAGNDHPKVKPVKKHRFLWLLAGIGVLFILAAIGGGMGYGVAIQERLKQEADQVALTTTTQFQLGLADLEAGRYTLAQQRFQYVLQLDPTFPGAAEKLTEVMVILAQQTTPTTAPTPTLAITATPDTRTTDQLYALAQQYLRAQDWNNAILALDALRTADLAYHTVEVDGMYYTALRYRGVNKILVEGNLEGGMYDLAVVERFGPLDKEAAQYRDLARMYMAGTSYWGIDWYQVVTYLSQVYMSLPGLHDSTGWTATERYRIALIHYGDQLAAAGDYCGARDQYQESLYLGQDPGLIPTATYVQFVCSPPTATPTVTTEIIIVPTFTETPTLTP